MASFTTDLIPARFHRAVLDWQQRYFPEMHLVTENWDKHFKGQVPFQLTARIGDALPTVTVGEFAGQPKLERAGDMKGNMFYSARDIIRAQCSTEFGSIQQHRLTLDGAFSDRAKYDVLRIMAEELRHAYQMFWVLAHDPSWKKLGMGDVGEETMEELLSMQTGSHVLDAFNIVFNEFADNVIFASVIDLVGKYQLEMQKVFVYAPMARSMPPMLSEEGFHLASGRRNFQEVALRAARGEYPGGLGHIQKILNQWVPRGLEMFGSETGGATVIHFGFKDQTNAAAQGEYMAEVKEKVVEPINLALIQQRLPGTTVEKAREILSEAREAGDYPAGLEPADLLVVPDNRFFRKRGMAEWLYQPYDVAGRLLMEKGKPVSPQAYEAYLNTVLPPRFVASVEFDKYCREAEEHRKAAW
jgi:1,2-phenylacetyl-CoA epoxidase catalytic subunit